PAGPFRIPKLHKQAMQSGSG
nr:2S albumin small chain nII - rape (fragments) [Brassica napus]